MNSRDGPSVYLDETPNSTAHSRTYSEIRFTALGVLGSPPNDAGPSLAYRDGKAGAWDFMPWRRVLGVTGIEDPDDLPDEVPDDVFERAAECHAVEGDAVDEVTP